MSSSSPSSLTPIGIKPNHENTNILYYVNNKMKDYDVQINELNNSIVVINRKATGFLEELHNLEFKLNKIKLTKIQIVRVTEIPAERTLSERKINGIREKGVHNISATDLDTIVAENKKIENLNIEEKNIFSALHIFNINQTPALSKEIKEMFDSTKQKVLGISAALLSLIEQAYNPELDKLESLIIKDPKEYYKKLITGIDQKFHENLTKSIQEEIKKITNGEKTRGLEILNEKVKKADRAANAAMTSGESIFKTKQKLEEIFSQYF